MEKHPTAYRTISEVAREVGLEPHVLRFWESKFPQLQPLKRAGGRRYYRPEDVETIIAIRELLHERRFTIEGARRALSAGIGTAEHPRRTAGYPRAHGHKRGIVRRYERRRIASRPRRVTLNK